MTVNFIFKYLAKRNNDLFLPKQNKTKSQKSTKQYLSCFIYNHLKLEATRYPEFGKWINKMWYIHIVECYSATKRNGLLIYTGFSSGSVVKNLPTTAGDTGLILGSGRAPEEGNGNPLHYSCPENPSDRGVWLATIHGVTKELATT